MNGEIRPLPELERLHELFNYNPETGLFIRKVSRGKTKEGDVAGTISCGYIGICVDWVVYRAHRLAWLWMTGQDPGEMEIDHKDGNTQNNIFSNLRLATRLDNSKNTRVFSTNKTGFRGVSYDKIRGKYVAEIISDRVKHRLGRFDTAEEAASAYSEASKRLHGQFSRETLSPPSLVSTVGPSCK